MIILGIDLDKCNATKMFEKLEREVEFQKTVAKAHATFAVNCYRREFIEDKYFISNGKCSFISDEQYEQMKSEFSELQCNLQKYMNNKNQEMWDILDYSTLFQEEREYFETERKMFSSGSDEFRKLSINISQVKTTISTIGYYYNKYKKIN